MYLKKVYENWNVDCKKPILVHNELSNLDFDVVALRETRLESGIQKFDNFALFNSELESKKYEFGCGFYVSGEFLKYVKDFKIITERIY
jgi:hypothetical protein